MDNVTSLHAVVLGLDGFVVFHAEHHAGELALDIATVAHRAFCRGCGVRAESKGRRVTEVRDVPFGDRPVRLVWHKRIWRCLEDACPTRSWSEQTEAIRPRASLSKRPGCGRCVRSAATGCRSRWWPGWRCGSGT